MKHLKKLTLLHSNDLHGDFMVEKVDNKLVGGVSMLSGYVNKVRREEENVVYAIAGDMFQGSLIDKEYKGVSTIEIMNLLAPDVVTIGNHEVDYGLAHLLFLEKCANFPIINANMYLKTNGRRLFHSHRILKIGGMQVLFIGILTEEVLQKTKLENLIGTLVDIKEAADEVGRICDAYQTEDIDFTVLLTHIGIEADRKLAAILDPRWGVDLIIGGHSHTLLEKPIEVNGIPIVQAASGTDQIGRFDIMVDTDLNSIDSYTWQLIPITPENCPEDEVLKEVIEKYHNITETKYNRILTRFPERYTHPVRNRETQVGKIFADAFKISLGLDIMLHASGSLRSHFIGPVMTLKDLQEMEPFDEEVYRYMVTGKQLRRMMKYMLREEAFDADAHTEFYQFSEGMRVVYNRKKKKVVSLTMYGQEVGDEEILRVGMHKFHFKNLQTGLGISEAEVARNGMPKVVATRSLGLLEEYFTSRPFITASIEKRLVIEE
ncbi:MAG: bifunctional metallophosphatase/5'-nucleotidase [Acidaminococcaceae bacterium]|nr:bifunctional metallophosphatase/5'-nucleotidase [Acidaminococcaceae bacterium]